MDRFLQLISAVPLPDLQETIDATLAFNVSALMAYRGMTLQQAEDEMIFRRLETDDGGLIAFETRGDICSETMGVGLSSYEVETRLRRWK